MGVRATTLVRDRWKVGIEAFPDHLDLGFGLQAATPE